MVSEDKQQILDIKVKYEDAIYGIIRYKEKIDQLKQSIKDLQQQEKDKTITTNEMKLQTEAINATISCVPSSQMPPRNTMKWRRQSVRERRGRHYRSI